MTIVSTKNCKTQKTEEAARKLAQDPQRLADAIRKHDWDFCHALITFGIDLNAECGDSPSALYYLISHSSAIPNKELISLASEMLEAGADVNNHGSELLSIAVSELSPELVDLLLSNGVDPNSGPTDPLFTVVEWVDSMWTRYGKDFPRYDDLLDIAESLIKHNAHVTREALQMSAGDTHLFNMLYKQITVQIMDGAIESADVSN